MQLEDFEQFVDDDTLRRAVETHRSHCVVRASTVLDGWVAFVEDLRTEEMHELELGAGDGLWATCTCGADEPLCEHAIAAFLHIELPPHVRPPSRVRDAIREHQTRAKAHVIVRRLKVDDSGVFGHWSATTKRDRRPTAHTYRVTLRSLKVRANSCTCHQFVHDRLGTCEHVEAVLEAAQTINPDAVHHGVPTIYVKWGRVPRAVTLDGSPLPVRPGRGWEVTPDARALLAGNDGALRVGAEAPLPTSFEGELYPHQVVGARFLANCGRAVLADDMGLGKTVQAIVAAEWMRECGEVNQVLVVCPASVKHQWKREIERFCGKEAVVPRGGPRGRAQYYAKRLPFSIVSYECARLDQGRIRGVLRPDLVILDEVHRVKNRETKTAEGLRALQSRFVFGLTGTPLENNLHDVFGIMEVVHPEVFGPLWQFEDRYVVRPCINGAPEFVRVEEARRRLEPFVLRRKKSVIEQHLPELDVRRHVVIIGDDQLAIQRAAIGEAERIRDEAEAAKRRLTPGEERRVMMLLNQARMVGNAAPMVRKKPGRSPKLDKLRFVVSDLLDRHDKILIFSEWRWMLQRVEEVLDDLHVGHIRLDGQVPTSRRGELIQKFEHDSRLRIMTSTDAGGVGLNLQMASAIVNVELPWNPAKLDQRLGRIHRLGQQRDAIELHFLVSNGYELKVEQSLQAKRRLFERGIPEAA